MTLNAFSFLRAVAVFAALAGVMAAAGCATSQSETERAMMQRQINAIDERVEFMYRNVKVQADVATNLAQLQDSLTTLTGQIEEINARMQMLTERIEKTERGISQKRVLEGVKSANIRLEKTSERIQRLTAEVLAYIDLMERRNKISQQSHQAAVKKVIASGRLEQFPETVLAPLAPPKDRQAAIAPEEQYKRAYNAYLRGDYDEAIMGFSDYLRQYPETELSDNAAYWIGEALFGKADYGKAFRAFDSMAENYPQSNKAPAAILKSAKVMSLLHNEKAARERLRLIIERYPTSNEAIVASEKLESPAQQGN